MGVRDKLNEDEKAIFDDLYIKSKELYPNLLNEMYENVIYFYIINGCNDDCFNKLIEENENKKSSNNTEDNDKANEVLSTG